MKLDQLVALANKDSNFLAETDNIVHSFKMAQEQNELANSKNKNKLIEILNDDIAKVAKSQSGFNLSGDGDLKILTVGDGSISLSFSPSRKIVEFGVTLDLVIKYGQKEVNRFIGIKPISESQIQPRHLKLGTISAVESKKLNVEMLEELQKHTVFLQEQTKHIDSLKEFEYFAFDGTDIRYTTHLSFKDSLEQTLENSSLFKNK